jgi:DNA adenine methylase
MRSMNDEATHGTVANEMERLPPLFRWPGGKRWLLAKLVGFLPNQYGRYFEPFFGAGAFYFRLRPSTATISDANVELMDCYRALRDEPDRVAAVLEGMERHENAYYRIRATNPSNSAERAARFIYLSSLAFNGIHRVNKLGEFNVPYGGREYAALGSEESLRKYGRALAAADITSGDFETAVSAATSTDLVYLDPPYTVAHSNNGFVKYNARIFSWRDQERLAATAEELRRRGCHVIVSNAYHDSLRQLYPNFRATVVPRRSSMAAAPSRRVDVHEYLFTNDG